MIPIRTIDATVIERYSEGVLGEPIELTLTMDEAWTPRIQGTMVLDSNVVAAIAAPGGSTLLGKMQGDVVSLRLRTDFGPRFTVADLTAVHGGSVAAVTAAHGGTVASLTEAHTYPWNPGEEIEPLHVATSLYGGSVAAVTAAHGGALAEITKALRVPGGSYLRDPSEELIARLKWRRITPDRKANTVTYQLSGDEIRLHDYRRFETTTWVSTHTSLRGLVRAMLLILEVPALAPGPDITIPAGGEWKPGQTMWDFLHPIMESVGFTLWADLDGRYHLNTDPVTTAPVALHRERNLIDFTTEIDTTRAYAGGAVVEYTDAPDDSTKWDVYALPGAKRILHETRPGARQVAGAAEQLVNRSRTRATTGKAVTTQELRLRPLQRVQVLSGMYPEYGTVQAVTWDYRSAETSVTLRDISSS